MQELQREDLVIECQKMDSPFQKFKATKDFLSFLLSVSFFEPGTRTLDINTAIALLAFLFFSWAVSNT